jgi:D-alanyl-D-alanine carboxypeptidase (penicillin-binding protein 5/6)
MRYPEFREMVATEYASIFTPYREIPLANTNELLFSYPPATGVKTGTTPAAGETLIWRRPSSPPPPSGTMPTCA